MADQIIIICQCGQANRLTPPAAKQGWFSCGRCGKRLDATIPPLENAEAAPSAPPPPKPTPTPPKPTPTPSPVPFHKRRAGLVGFAAIMGAAVVIHLFSSPTLPPVAPTRPAPAPAPSPTPTPITQTAPPAFQPYTPPAFQPPPQNTPAPRPLYVPPAAPQPSLVPVAIRNGVIRQKAYGQVPLKVVADYGTNYALKLVSVYNNAEVSLFYVASGATVQVNVPPGQYYVRGASGSQWYGERNLFGPDTRYFRMTQRNEPTEEASRFTFQNGRMYTLTLQGVSGGNINSPSISAADF